tara:strand:+ start:789 stop:1112 length:324 start_codon:yes stop_codon:yes gene_type:complete
VANKRIEMKTKEKVKFWLEKYPSLKDDDNRLCANIWATEIGEVAGVTNKIEDFLIAYASNKLTSAHSIERMRRKLQEEYPELRGEKYNLRKGIIQDQWRKDLGYETT